ncbi:chaplin [Streptomyces sp. NPDC002446]
MAHRIKSAFLSAGAFAVVLGGAGLATADSGAQGASLHSPGVLSGNTIQAPTDAATNLCGNTINIVGLLNPAFGNTCVND